MNVEKWSGEAATTTRRVGHAPGDVPKDGEWYVMRSSEWVGLDAGKYEKRTHSQRITQAVKYLNSRRAETPGFVARKVREEVREEGEGMVRWHMLGRWTS